jgi:branched-chain amino acid transport system permease protein
MFTAAIVTGLGLGSMYALLALGFHLTYVVSRTVNFAQGSAMMVGAVLGYTFCITWGWSLWLALPLTLILCALYGLVIERLAGTALPQSRLTGLADGNGGGRYSGG